MFLDTNTAFPGEAEGLHAREEPTCEAGDHGLALAGAQSQAGRTENPDSGNVSL